MRKRSDKRSALSFGEERGRNSLHLYRKEWRLERAPLFSKERVKERAPEIRGATNALQYVMMIQVRPGYAVKFLLAFKGNKTARKMSANGMI